MSSVGEAGAAPRWYFDSGHDGFQVVAYQASTLPALPDREFSAWPNPRLDRGE